MLSRTAQTGVGIIEVLVTVLVMATALLAITAMHVKSLEYNHSSYIKSQANILVSDIADRMRLNRPSISQYKIDFGDSLPSGTSLVATDIREWGQSLAQLLPGGQGSISCVEKTSVTYECKIGIQWNEAGTSSDADPTSSLNTLYYSTQI